MKSSNKIFEIPLIGVETEHSAKLVDLGLANTKGVNSHSADLSNSKAIIESAADAEIVQSAVTSVKDLGYDIAFIRKQYPVTGMTCAACAVSVESILQSESGVLKAGVNFATQTVQVEYIPTIAGPLSLKNALQGVGYDMIVDESDDVKTSLEKEHRRHYENLKKRAWWAAGLSIPLVVIGMFFMNMPYAKYLLWILSTPIVLWTGRKFFLNAYKQARHRRANMDTLVALSTGIAYAFSVFNTLAPQFWTSRGLEAHVYFEAAGVVIAFVLLGKLLEEGAKANTSSAIKKLMGLQPSVVTIVHEGGYTAEIPIANVKVGNILLIKPGGKIPVDGKVTEGNSYVDESMITGEPVPVSKQINDDLFAGTINQKGSFQMAASKIGSDTLLAGIIKLVQEAQGSKAPVQKLVDKIAGIFVPVVVALSLVTFGSWLFLGGDNGITHGLLAMVTVLVIACPCALGLATPTAIMVGVGKGAENGILIKDAESLEQAQKLNALILDKTGTITEGRPSVSNVFWVVDETAVLKDILFSIEKASEHPLADAIAEYLQKEASILSIQKIESLTGRGITAFYNDQKYWIGNRKMAADHSAKLSTRQESLVNEWEEGANTVVIFGKGKEIIAIISIADKIKDSSAAAIRQLKDINVEVYMLTGDNRKTAATVAGETGIDQYKAEVMPAGKYEFVKHLQQQGKVVGMVGDGINDSQALALADVSIAMGKGSDIAMDVAKMTLISNDLLKIPAAIKLSRKTVAAIRQNLFWAFIYNIIGIPIAAGILYPLNGFLLNPMIAGAAMALSSFSVVSNSLRLKWTKITLN